MDADLFIESVNLKEPTRTILDETEQLTGKPFCFIHAPDLTVQAVVKIARSSMDHHIIKYSSTDSSLLNHLIAHECGHIRRYYAAPKEERLVPASNNLTYRNAIMYIEKCDSNLLKSYPIYHRYQIANLWIDGLIQQVTNQPSDTYIEQWIFNEYPELRNDQQRSLGQIHTRAMKALDPTVNSKLPRIIVESSTSMNYAFFKKIDQTTGSTFFESFEQLSARVIGEDLFCCIGDEDKGLVGDISIANEWAEILQIRDWFTWGDFEDIPSGYEG